MALNHVVENLYSKDAPSELKAHTDIYYLGTYEGTVPSNEGTFVRTKVDDYTYAIYISNSRDVVYYLLRN